MEKKSVKLPITAVETINKILEKGGEALIRYSDSNEEIIIYNQTVKIKTRVQIE